MNPDGQSENQNKSDLSSIGSQKQSQNSYDYKDNSATHLFLYIVSFLSLSFVSFGLGAILFQIINKNFPGMELSFSPYNFQESIVKYGLSSIIIATPIYFILTFLINKYLFEGKISENSRVRKWTTYITLFLAFAVILGDLVVLVNSWLSGTLATRFLLKILIIIAVAGTVFAYYFWDMHKKNMTNTRYMGNKIFGFSVLTIIVAVFISSFFMIDTPALARKKNIDARTVSSIYTFSVSIYSYYDKNNQLPSDITDLGKNQEYFRNLNQPEDNPIIYKKTGAYTYELCANFKRSDRNDDRKNKNYFLDHGEEWKHDAGKVCFKKEVEPKKEVIPVESRTIFIPNQD